MTKVAALAAIGTLGFLAVALPTPGMGEPVPRGDSPTVYVTVRVPVQRLSHGHSAGYWRWRNVQANVRLGQRTRERDRARHQLQTSQQRLARERDARRARWSHPGLSGAINALLCIHGGEGAWTSETGNGFHGGLQMDDRFEGQYGAWARRRYGYHAGSWPADVQILVGLTAFYSGRGWYPWPMTARACGLIG